MKQKYFINIFFLPSGLTLMEERIAEIARGAIYCVYDRPSLEAFANYLRKQHDLFLSQNKRVKPVEIMVDFHDDVPDRDVTFHIGRMWIPVLKVAKEILEDEGG